LTNDNDGGDDYYEVDFGYLVIECHIKRKIFKELKNIFPLSQDLLLVSIFDFSLLVYLLIYSC
jgi:hypothetical protein